MWRWRCVVARGGLSSFSLLVAVLAAGGCGGGDSFVPPAADVAPDDAVDLFVAKGGLPALAVAIVDGGQILYSKVAGIRKRGDATLVAGDDAFHIGSNTKGMTALVAGTVVDEGLLKWDSTVGDVLGGTVAVGAYGAVTLSQLLSHSSGMPEYPTAVELAIDAETKPVEDQRHEAAATALGLSPASAAGTQFLYAGGNYVVAGLMLENVTTKSWETLLTERLFVPLGMPHAGFGLPGTPGRVDAPWGHEPDPVDPGTTDIAPGFGPAGTVHASLGDLINYVQVYLNGGFGPNGRIVSDATLAEIETPRLEHYGLGWLTGRSDAGVKRMVHNGSNRRFYSLMVLFPERRAAMVMLTNDGTDPSWARVDQVAAYFAAHFGLPPKSPWAN